MLERSGILPADCAPPGCREAAITVFILDELGLHARPAARLAQAAGAFTCDIRLGYEGMEANAKSILDILSLAAARGGALTITCRGDDAEEAARTLGLLFEGALIPKGA